MSMATKSNGLLEIIVVLSAGLISVAIPWA